MMNASSKPQTTFVSNMGADNSGIYQGFNQQSPSMPQATPWMASSISTAAHQPTSNAFSGKF